MPAGVVLAARDALIRASMPGERGIRYTGAGIRLLRIAEEADISVRGGSLRGFTLLPDQNEGREHLRRIAVSQNPVAHMAVRLLADDSGAEGEALLRVMYVQDLVTEPSARREISAIAKARGWK